MRQEMPKQSIIRQNVYKNTIELILYRPSTTRNEACPLVWLTYQVRLHRRKLIFPLQAEIKYRYLLG